MHRRFISTVAMLMAMTLCLTGCTSEASNVGVAKDKDQAMDTGFTASTAGSYDSADTAVVTTIDQENSAAVFMNMETGRQYTLYYDGTTYVKDKHDGPMTISQIKPGDVVDVTFLKGKKHLASIKRSPQAWVYDEIQNYDLGGPNKTASIGSSTYALPDDVVVLSEGERSEVMDVVAQDVLTVSGIDHKIYSISVERGHGYLRLKNDQALIGGWIEVGNSVIREITEDMLLVVPEGSYQVLLSNYGTSGTKDVVIERDKEVVLDVGDLEITENKTGRILFNVTPDTAKVSIDGKVVDISKAIELPYGIHQVHLEARGYDSLTKYIQVGSEFATISFELEEERDDDERRTVSNNTIEDTYKPREPVQNTNNESLSENALKPKSGNRVYIDGPKNVEVYLDNNYVGISPVSFKKTVGSHTITLRKSGYKTKSYTIYLYNDGEDITYSFPELLQETVSGNTTKPNGSVSENSLIKVHIEEPEGVKVFVEDELVGTTPCSFERVAGHYKVTLFKEGYESKDYSFQLKNDRRDVTYRLEPLKEGHQHNYHIEEIIKEATCTEAGKKALKCECGEIKEVDLPATGHHYEGGTCKDCGVEEPKEHEHSFEETGSTPATCTEAGKKTFECECGETKEEDLPATGHHYEGGTCKDCGVEEPKEHEHSFEETSSTPATCTEAGKKTFKCKCGETKTEEILAAGHNYKDGECTKCHEKDPDYQEPEGDNSDTSNNEPQTPIAPETTTERIVQNSNSRRKR